MKKTAYIGLGANIGDRYRSLQMAIDMLGKHQAIEVVACSHFYETDPIGFVDQPAFLNGVVRIETKRSAEELLQTLQQIELTLGRERKVRWGPRTIDLDLLMYEQEKWDTLRLTLPHPRMKERAFVLIPLLDVLIGDERILMESALTKLDKGGVTQWKTTS